MRGTKLRMRGIEQAGFTLVELMITMVIFLLVITAASNIFSALLNQFKQQSAVAETNIEGIPGLEVLRFDIEQAGYGLPWTVDANGDRAADPDWTGLQNYCEAVSVAATATVPDPSVFNDANVAAGCTNGNAPRALVAGNNVGLNGADYLVIKAANVATNDAAQKWSYIRNDGAVNQYMANTGVASEAMVNNERVIVLLPSRSGSQNMLLTQTAGSHFALYNTSLASFTVSYDRLVPMSNSYLTHLVYGVNADTDLRMPFNRADYYISTTNVPTRCAAGTGVLIKSVLNQANGIRGGGMPLLDCVADMQVFLRLDMNDDGQAATTANADGSAVVSTEGATAATVLNTLANAQNLRNRLKEVRVFVLSHDGQRDPFFTFTNLGPAVYPGACATCVRIGDPATLFQDLDLSAVGADFLNYRWKIHVMVLTLHNVRGR